MSRDKMFVNFWFLLFNDVRDYVMLVLNIIIWVLKLNKVIGNMNSF